MGLDLELKQARADRNRLLLHLFIFMFSCLGFTVLVHFGLFNGYLNFAVKHMILSGLFEKAVFAVSFVYALTRLWLLHSALERVSALEMSECIDEE